MNPTNNRGVLYVAIAIVSHLLTNSKESMNSYELLMLVGGAVLAGLITLRAFIDQTATNPDQPQKVEVMNTPADPVPTTQARQ